jgi:hypothetical protein
MEKNMISMDDDTFDKEIVYADTDMGLLENEQQIIKRNGEAFRVITVVIQPQNYSSTLLLRISFGHDIISMRELSTLESSVNLGEPLTLAYF